MALKICVYKPARGGQTEVEEKEALSSVILKPKSTPAYVQEPCTVCLDLQDDLRVLPCGHLMCYNCLVRWMKTKLEEGTEPTCHACRAIITTLEDIASQFPTDLEHDVQASADRLHRYCPEDFNHKVEVGKTDPLFDTDIYKSRQRGTLSNELSKSANDKEYQQFIQVVQDSTARRASCIWMSDTLSADLNLPLNAKPPDCKLVQMFVLGEDLQAILLSVYDGSVGKANEKSQVSLKEEVLRFTAKTARVLSGCLHRYCYCDFIIIPCALPQSAFRDKDALCQEVEIQETFVRSYYGGPVTLTETAYNKLRTATTTLSSTSFVPCFLLDGQNQDDKKEWMLSFDSDSRSVVSLFIESLTRKKTHRLIEVTYTDETKEKLRVAAIEAAKRLSHQYKVQIVSNDVTVGKCVEKLQKQTKTEYDDGVTLNLDHVPLTDEESQPLKCSLTASQVLESQRPQQRGRYSKPGVEERDSASSSAEECSVCRKNLPVRATTVVECTELRLNSCMVSEFMKAINACFNVGEGCVIVHMNISYSFGHFHEYVDDRLMQILPDDSTYHENFESFALDEEHMVVRVIARQRSSLSTLNFHTKLSFDAGLRNPTHVQMRRLLAVYEQHEKQKPEPRSSRLHQSVNFTQGKEVTVPSGVFQEGLRLQAKRIARGVHDIDRKLNCDDLLRCMLGQCSLKNYICAFSKIPEGGSVYFGIQEEMVRTEKRISPRKSVCEGCSIDSEERQKIEAIIQESVATEMLWLGSSPPRNPVEVHFHPVEGAEPDRCVVEIVVKYFHGISFHHREGPEAYTYRMVEGGLEVQRIRLDEWLRGNKSSLIPQVPVFT